MCFISISGGFKHAMEVVEFVFNMEITQNGNTLYMYMYVWQMLSLAVQCLVHWSSKAGKELIYLKIQQPLQIHNMPFEGKKLHHSSFTTLTL